MLDDAPRSSSTSADSIRIATAEFVVSAPNLKACPPLTYPEVAIAGRSNVGKSSLINHICNRRHLAKTSNTPGKTRLINFFHLALDPDSVHLHLVDLPGYGYAKIDKASQQQWARTLQEFLEWRPLAAIIHLIDCRHEPTALDKQMREWIAHQKIPSITILTKADKLSSSQLAQSRSRIVHSLHLQKEEPCLATSTLKKTGAREILQALHDVILGASSETLRKS
ncbi:MAG: ribosome biogenesis GTP-binding protein YihA/YsxC [Candidatus Omnitrophota bacterium]